MSFTLIEALDVLKPLGILLAEIVIYAIFIFKFYRFLASWDIITASLVKSARMNIGRWFLYLLEHLVLLFLT